LNPVQLAAEVQNGTGLTLDKTDAECLLTALEGKYTAPGNRQHDSFVGRLGELMANFQGIGWTGTTHTSDWAPLLALGPGRELFHGLHDNTAVFEIITELARISSANPRFHGPSVSPAAAPDLHMKADTSA
jgi:alkaline phosphatase